MAAGAGGDRPRRRAGLCDYAHTPDAVVAALEALRRMRRTGDHRPGAGGDRDEGKARRNGRGGGAARRQVIVTTTSQGEDPAAIRRAVARRCSRAIEIGGRRDAIRAAIAQSAPATSFLLAGKGHNQGQTVGTGCCPSTT